MDDAFARVAADLERDDLGKARDRLEGMIDGYPASLAVREQLGDIYWRLHYPERAGKHWYLIESARPEMDVAKQAFEARHHGDPLLILNDLRWRGGLEPIAGTYAAATLTDLAQRAGVPLERIEKASDSTSVAPFEPWWSKFVPAALVVVLVSLLVSSCVGLFTILGMAGKWIAG